MDNKMTYWQKVWIGLRWNYTSWNPLKSTAEDIIEDTSFVIEELALALLSLVCLMGVVPAKILNFIFGPFLVPFYKDSPDKNWRKLKDILESK